MYSRTRRSRRRRRFAAERPMRKIERRLDKIYGLVDQMFPVADDYYPVLRRLELIEEYADIADAACQEVKGYPATLQQLEDLEIECSRMQGAFNFLVRNKREWWANFGGQETGWSLSELETDLSMMGKAIDEIGSLVDAVKDSRKTL